MSGDTMDKMHIALVGEFSQFSREQYTKRIEALGGVICEPKKDIDYIFYGKLPIEQIHEYKYGLDTVFGAYNEIALLDKLTDKSKIEPALMRDGRHYLGEPLHFRMLTPMEAVEARAAAGLPKFDVVPKSDIPLATALRKPRKKIYLKEGEVVVQTGRSLN